MTDRDEDRAFAALLKQAGSLPDDDPAAASSFMARLQRVPDAHPRTRALHHQRSFLAGLLDLLPRPWILAEGGALAAALCLGLVAGYGSGIGGSEDFTDLDLSASLMAASGDLDLYEEGSL